MAWLNAVPKPPKGSKRAEGAVEQTLSRRDQLKRDGIEPKMPPNPMPHLVARLVEIGLVSGGGMGPAPLSWEALDAWQRMTRVALAPWEARLLRSLSAAHIVEASLADDETRPAPWHAELTQRERDRDEALLNAVLG